MILIGHPFPGVVTNSVKAMKEWGFRLIEPKIINKFLLIL